MSDREILRGQLMGQLVEGKLDQRTAAERLGVSVRQVKRLKRSYLAEGISGVISKHRGVPSNRRIKPDVLAQALALIRTHYTDFGPTLACEKLRERHGVVLSVETLRKQMVLHGLWVARKAARVQVHQMRERRSRRGELIQVDGSPHDWFEGRSARCCLLVFIDDATGALTHLQFVDVETTANYMAALHRHIALHGLPAALYSDRHSIFRINAKEPSAQNQTQFARALKQLGIAGIQANSPQAKGRVERANQTLQDRLVKEMRLAGINDQGAANAWLPGYILAFNRRFAVGATCAQDAHVPYLGKTDALRRILSIQEDRVLSKNLSCQYEGALLQVKLAGTGIGMRGATVRVHQHHDGTIELRWKGRTLSYEQMVREPRIPQAVPVDGKRVNTLVDQVIAERSRNPAGPRHPWRKVKADAFGQQVIATF